MLAQSLSETIQRVLSVSYQKRCKARLLGCMTELRCGFVLGNDCSLIESLVGYLQDSVVQMGLCDSSECTRIGVALEEALVNAMHHGNLEVASAVRGESDEAYYALVTQRGREPPYRDRRIHVEVNLSRDRAVFVVRDEGPGFNPAALPDPDDPANLERVCGRGVLLMQAFMDEVNYNARGNSVTLVKRRCASGANGEVG